MLSVCMIVKNEAEKLKLTLPQLVRRAAEVIVVDTGSSDETVAVAKELGARVEHFTWIDDFSAARNYSLTFATQPWIAWLDADEYLREEDAEKLIVFLQAAEPATQAFSLIMSESPFGQTVRGKSYLRTKVFRNKLGVHFVRPINEQTVDAEGKPVLGPVLPIVLYHWGRNLGADEMAVKKERYLRLYQEHLRRNPDDPYVSYLLGNLLRSSGGEAEALAAFAAAVDHGQNDRALLIQSLTGKAETELKLGRLKETFQSASRIRELEPGNAAAINILATILIAAGKIEPAVQGLEELLKSPAGIDPVREQIIPRMVLAEACRKLGQTARADSYESEVARLKEKYNAGK
ncbi:MAG: glycosyltransferase family 2 protein [Candidatus Saganbacteria bacterium]|nr:glycosyltransferase family 2 protein [Candidatus Saganbacteria bacterium]